MFGELKHFLIQSNGVHASPTKPLVQPCFLSSQADVLFTPGIPDSLKKLDWIECPAWSGPCRTGLITPDLKDSPSLTLLQCLIKMDFCAITLFVSGSYKVKKNKIQVKTRQNARLQQEDGRASQFLYSECVANSTFEGSWKKMMEDAADGTQQTGNSQSVPRCQLYIII